ncbi:MAG: hypothetical protein ACREL5_08610 [Gemmatimonadales bacterium]
MATAVMNIKPGWRATVTADRNDSIILTLPSGATQLQRFEQREIFALRIDSDGGVWVRLDSVTLGSGEPSADAPIGAVWRGRLDDLRASGLHLASGGAAAERYSAVVRRLLPQLPADGVSARLSWRDSASAKLAVDVFSGEERRSEQWSSGAVIGNDGGELPVKVSEKYEQYGEGETSGHPMTMTAQGRRSGTYYVTMDGTIRRASLGDSAAVLISVRDSRQLIPTMRYSSTAISFESPSSSEAAAAQPIKRQ